MSSSHAEEEHLRQLAAAVKRLESLQRKECFDPVNPESRATTAQQEIIDDFGVVPLQYVVAGNQAGKTQVASRNLTWAMTASHPSWKRPSAWGNEPLLCIVAGRTGKQLEESLLPKLVSYLEPGSYKVVRIGNIIQKLEIISGPGAGNRFIFQSLENPTMARERLQSYVAHFAWCDEMPPTIEVLTELETRVQSRNGFLLCTFTPLAENIQIQKKVDAAHLPHAKKYKLRRFDNPLYSSPEQQAKILASLETESEAVRLTRLEGEWSSSDSAVYHFDYDKMCRPLPESYSRTGWRHVVSVDPALQSACGLQIWAENPLNGDWYLVLSREITGVHDPNDMELACFQEWSKYRVEKRISDTTPWFQAIAAKQGRPYIGVYKKVDRKGQLIKGLQAALGTQVFIPPHNTEFIDQLMSCKWADGDRDRIVNASTKHMVDCAQYFVDNIPKYETQRHTGEWWQELAAANASRLAKEDAAIRRQERMAASRKHKMVVRRSRR